jgi:hypothetical protein
MRSKIKLSDLLFDITGFLILMSHMLMWFYGIDNQVLPSWALVLFFLVTRTSLAGVGHYHDHRKKDGVTDWGDVLFDIQYVGTAITAFDGHSYIHHS